jgi:hypothetical protein
MGIEVGWQHMVYRYARQERQEEDQEEVTRSGSSLIGTGDCVRGPLTPVE